MADKPVVWLHGEVKTPPFSSEARRLAGHLLRVVQRGTALAMPDSRPMPSIGAHCHELRIRDAQQHVIWRIIYRIDSGAIVIGDLFAKKTQKTPKSVIDSCVRRFALYDRVKR